MINFIMKVVFLGSRDAHLRVTGCRKFLTVAGNWLIKSVRMVTYLAIETLRNGGYALLLSILRKCAPINSMDSGICSVRIRCKLCRNDNVR